MLLLKNFGTVSSIFRGFGSDFRQTADDFLGETAGTDPELSVSPHQRQTQIAFRLVVHQSRPFPGRYLSQTTLISFSNALNSGSPVTSSAFFPFVSAAAKK